MFTLRAAIARTGRLVPLRYASTSANVAAPTLITPEPTAAVPSALEADFYDALLADVSKTITELEPSSEFIASGADLRPSLFLPLSSLITRKPGEVRPSRQVISLAPSVFAHPLRRDILHACVVHHLDSLRQGTASVKGRGQVHGSGRKLRAQKGSGKARVGDKKSPIRKGGGVSHGPHPRDFSTKLPRKVREMGMRVALSVKVREQNFEVVPNLRWEGLKTNMFWRKLKANGWDKGTLFVVGEAGEEAEGEIPRNLELVSRNLQGVDVIPASELNVYEALKWKRLVMDPKAVAYFADWLSKPDQEDVRDQLGHVMYHPDVLAAPLAAPVEAKVVEVDLPIVDEVPLAEIRA